MKFRLSVLISSMLAANMVHAVTQVDLSHNSASKIKQQLSSLNNSNQDFKIIRKDVDFNQTTHTRIQQMYHGMPVWGATGVIHTPKTSQLAKGAVNASMNGRIYQGLEKDLARKSSFAVSKYSRDDALQLAKSLFSKKNRLASAKYENESSQAIIFIDENNNAHYANLVSFITYNPVKGPQRPTFIIDAESQKVYQQWDRIKFSNQIEDKAREKVQELMSSSGNNDFPLPLYSIKAGGIGGNPNLGEVVYDGAPGHKTEFDLKAFDYEAEILPGSKAKITLCFLKNDDIRVEDISYGSDLIYSVCEKSNNIHNGIAWLSMDKGGTRWKADEMNDGYSPSLDAFYAASMVKNMYQDWYGVPALIDEEGKPMKMRLRVHFGRNFDNAFWDGEQMTFGDGGSMFYPLTSVSVTAHEISHGFTDTYSNIDGRYPQMGALHESFSDMASVATEYYLNGETNWDIGREIKKDEGALRYLDNPRKDGHSIDHMKDFDATEVHLAGGITNKAFYLLATTKGWTVHKAFDVWVKANMHYWSSSMSTFNEAACGVVSATKDYSYDVADVRVAFSKVGIDTDNC